MHIRRRRGWELPEHEATPEHVFFNRRTLLEDGSRCRRDRRRRCRGHHACARRQRRPARCRLIPDPTADLYPAKRNEKYKLDRPVTEESINTSYNNFYEFGSSKSISRAAEALRVRPWTVKIDGMVEKPQENRDR